MDSVELCVLIMSGLCNRCSSLSFTKDTRGLSPEGTRAANTVKPYINTISFVHTDSCTAFNLMKLCALKYSNFQSMEKSIWIRGVSQKNMIAENVLSIQNTINSVCDSLSLQPQKGI